jgi:hypothetical protein
MVAEVRHPRVTMVAVVRHPRVTMVAVVVEVEAVGLLLGVLS